MSTCTFTVEVLNAIFSHPFPDLNPISSVTMEICFFFKKGSYLYISLDLYKSTKVLESESSSNADWGFICPPIWTEISDVDLALATLPVWSLWPQVLYLPLSHIYINIYIYICICVYMYMYMYMCMYMYMICIKQLYLLLC